MQSFNKQTVEFSDLKSTNPVEIPLGMDPSFRSNTVKGAELGDFLSRPVLIKSYTWTENTTLFDQIDPWYLYFSNSIISKKLENYSLINCKLKIKVIINSSPFYYGYAMVCYRPRHDINPDNINTASAYYTSQVLYSQQPRIDVYPQNNTGGEMTLPFMCDADWMELRFADSFTYMGQLTITTPQPLLNANSVSGGNCDIQIYACAEDVTITAPTLRTILQSEFSQEDGAISGPASSVANLASKLSKAPIIGPYAKATEMIASGVGSMAKLFGFSDPPVIKDSTPVKQHAYPALAVSDVSVPMDRLTVDSKQELTIDPKTVGLNTDDELEISKLVARESLICTVPWGGTQLPNERLFQCYVSPAIWDYLTGPPDRVYATPMAHVSQMFDFWRGDIIFRFKIICTQYHRGRLRISWDPQGANRTNADTIPAIFTKIVDISESTDVEIRIPYAQAFQWARCRAYSSTEYWIPGQFASDLKSYFDNGLISISILTKQTSPVADATIAIACFVRGAENLEFAAPKTISNSISYYIPQSEFQLVDEDEVESHDMGVTNPTTSSNLVFMGETIPSVRSLLRRTTLSRIASIPTASAGNSKIVYFASYMSRYPLYYGYDLNGINLATGSIKFNFVFNTPYSLIAPCFVGQRGGSNWTINVMSNRSVGLVRVERRNFTKASALYNYTTTIADTASASAVARAPLMFSGAGTGGASMTHQNNLAGLQVSCPHYSNKRFVSTSPEYATLGYSYGGLNPETDNIAVEVWLNPCDAARNITSQEAATTVYFNHEIGIDFNLFFFCNVPTIYIVAVPASA